MRLFRTSQLMLSLLFCICSHFPFSVYRLGFFLPCISINAITLRLPCKHQSEYDVKREDVVLQGYVFETLLFTSERECQLHCLMNQMCGSMNIEKTGEQRCELNNITAFDVEGGAAFKSKPRWKYISSNYSQTVVRISPFAAFSCSH